ncbi:MAG: YfhO family protein [Clostridiales bacterium]|nr:YfhO family protein [Clostridiales bacterium]
MGEIKENRFLLLSFILPALILTVAYAFFRVWPFGDGSVLVLDLNGQYLYYYEQLKNAIFSDGSLFYSWSRNLSGEFIGIIGYYLASPFSIITLLVPRAFITEGLLLMQIAKVGSCGFAFAYYLKKSHGGNDLGIVMFSTLYALMAYSVVEIMNPMWIDGLIFLPFIVLGIEMLVRENRILPFAIPLGLMFIANFYIGYMVGIFTFFYFLYSCHQEGKFSGIKTFGKKIGRYAIGGAIAVMLSSFMILPVYKALSLGKMDFSPPATYDITAKFTFFDFFVKLMPQTYDSVNVHGMPFVYCGVLTLMLIPLFFLSERISRREKVGGAILLGGAFLCMYVSIFDLAMHGMQWPNWLNYRYSFIFSFIMLMLAYKAFRQLEHEKEKNLYKVFAALLLAVIVIDKVGYEHAKTIEAIWLTIVALIIYLFMMVSYIRKKGEKGILIAITLVITAELLINSGHTFEAIDDEVLYSPRNNTETGRIGYTDWIKEVRPVVEEVYKIDNSFYRMEKTFHRTVNDPMALKMYGVSHSSSMMNERTMELIKKFGYTSRGFASKYNGGTIVGDSLLGIKYIMDNKNQDISEIYTDIYDEIYYDGNVIHVYENPYALPIGFFADSKVEDIDISGDDPFAIQNNFINSILGTDGVEYFKRIEIKERILENVEEKDAVDQMRYTPIIEGNNAHIEYLFDAIDDNQIYMYVSTKYHRDATIWFNRAANPVGSYFKDDEHVILPIGKGEQSQEQSLIITLVEDELFMIEPYFYSFDEDVFAKAVNQIRQTESVVNMKNAAKLRASVNAPYDGYFFTSIPYEKGWSAKVDGKKVKPVMVADSLLAIPITSGQHSIKLSFIPSGFIAGSIITLMGIAVVVFLILVSKDRIKFLPRQADKGSK